MQHCAQESPPGAEIRWLRVIDLIGKGMLAAELLKKTVSDTMQLASNCRILRCHRDLVQHPPPRPSHRSGKSADSEVCRGAAAVVDVGALEYLDVVEILTSRTLRRRTHVLAGPHNGALARPPATAAVFI